MTAELRQLWLEAFGDSQESIAAFFETGFSQHRYHYICKNGIPVSALYWFDCRLEGHKLAYIYAVATLKSHRGNGLAKRLMEETHEILKQQDYAGAILVPGGKGLFDFYEKIGYRTTTSVGEFTCKAAGDPITLWEIDAKEYARLRSGLLPKGGVVQDGAALAYLQTYAKLYAGEDFLLSATARGDSLLVHEFLGNPAYAGGILTALGMGSGRFRTPGKGQCFSMYFPFTANCPQPGYFGLALD